MRGHFRPDSSGGSGPSGSSSKGGSKGSSGVNSPERRPEKQTSTASRMIAGALGVRPPKKTEEMQRYEKAVFEKERVKRDTERELKRREDDEASRARRAVWED